MCVPQSIAGTSGLHFTDLRGMARRPAPATFVYTQVHHTGGIPAAAEGQPVPLPVPLPVPQHHQPDSADTLLEDLDALFPGILDNGAPDLLEGHLSDNSLEEHFLQQAQQPLQQHHQHQQQHRHQGQQQQDEDGGVAEQKTEEVGEEPSQRKRRRR